jgi:hypothetical protein
VIPTRIIRIPVTRAIFGFTLPAAIGRNDVRVIFLSISLSALIFRMVHPLIVNSKVAISPRNCHPSIGKDCLVKYPATPVRVNRKVWRSLSSGRMFFFNRIVESVKRVVLNIKGIILPVKGFLQWSQSFCCLFGCGHLRQYSLINKQKGQFKILPFLRNYLSENELKVQEVLPRYSPFPQV